MKRRVILLVLYALVFMFIGRNLPLPSFSPPKQEVKGADTVKIKSVVDKYLSFQKDSFSIYYRDLKSGESFGVDENKVLTGASLNKLFIIGYLYKLAKNKEVDVEDTIILQEDDIQDYGTGSLRYEEPGNVYSLRKLAQLCLEQSDNTAAHILALRLGKDKIQDYVNSLGFKSTDMEDNKTTALDTGRFLELLYLNRITSEAYTREILDYMKDTQFEDRLARFIPKSKSVYHKIGDATRMVHDVGIIEGKNSAFVLSILTHDVGEEEQMKKKLGEIAQLVSNEQVD